MTTLASRIVVEKKWWIAALAVLLVLNVAGYLVLVRPLTSSSGGTAARAAAAAESRRSAEREFAAVEAAQSAGRQADADLRTFYEQVLPASLTAARRMTYASLPTLAEDSGLTYRRRRTEVVVPQGDNRLQRLTMVMELRGPYQGLRRFIEYLEHGSDFIVVDDIRVTELETNGSLGVVVTLSTFFPGDADEP